MNPLPDWSLFSAHFIWSEGVPALSREMQWLGCAVRRGCSRLTLYLSLLYPPLLSAGLRGCRAGWFACFPLLWRHYAGQWCAWDTTVRSIKYSIENYYNPSFLQQLTLYCVWLLIILPPQKSHICPSPAPPSCPQLSLVPWPWAALMSRASPELGYGNKSIACGNSPVWWES